VTGIQLYTNKTKLKYVTNI